MFSTSPPYGEGGGLQTQATGQDCTALYCSAAVCSKREHTVLCSTVYCVVCSGGGLQPANQTVAPRLASLAPPSGQRAAVLQG